MLPPPLPARCRRSGRLEAGAPRGGASRAARHPHLRYPESPMNDRVDLDGLRAHLLRAARRHYERVGDQVVIDGPFSEGDNGRAEELRRERLIPPPPPKP
jgi:hypothetical protein